MGLFRPDRHETRSFENPSVSLSDASLIQLFGGGPTTAGPVVSEETAVGATIAVYRAVSLLAGLGAGLPLKVYKYKGRDEVQVRVLNNPGNGRTPFELWETVLSHLLLWGNAYVLKQRNQVSAITGLLPINPARVKVTVVREADTGELVKTFEVRHPTRDNASATMTNYDIMHIPGLSYDGVKGLSPIGVARQAVGISQSADELAARMYANGNMISGVLSTDRPLKKEQADALKAQWRDKILGSRHAHDIAILDAGTKFTPTAMAPEEAQFLQTRRWQTIEIARLYGIPPHLLGDVERSTSWGTGIEQQNTAFVAYTMQSWLRRIEQRITSEVVGVSTQFAEFDTTALLRGQTTERFSAYASGIQWGHLTRNEARVLENRPPLPGLDEPLTPLNMITAKNDEEGELAPGGVVPLKQVPPPAGTADEGVA